MLSKFDKDSRPDIKIKLTYIDWIIEVISLALLLALISLTVHNSSMMPDRIPTHFNMQGIPDGYGSKATIWILPGIGLFIYLLLTIIARIPRTYNFPVTITKENAEIQYKLATRFIRVLKALMLLMFAFINYKTLETALNRSGGLGKGFMPVFLLFIFSSITFYIVKSRNNRQNS
jgi:uncharacterized membrane protein